ncbi:MAG: hypothetical protein DME06_01025 [Candidatus Rokuibacteriota bacterium]|nr:MAG: hypothetical protein DME09_08705 [Candidatus Rokubacteria bacterium]PYN16592.1 MAG: hypothetical protein DME06_01025 [Candidatus Rokubacteria bacterium]
MVTKLLLLSIGTLVILGGCARPPAMQWWRVGTCLVLYEPAKPEPVKDERQIIVVGQACDIKREALSGQGAVTR